MNGRPFRLDRKFTVQEVYGERFDLNSNLHTDFSETYTCIPCKFSPPCEHLNAIIIGVHGAYRESGTPNAQGGKGVLFATDSTFNVSDRLKNPQATTQKAELSACLFALHDIENFKNWKNNDYRTTKGSLVKNADLFRMLEEKVTELKEAGVEVLFWHVPRRKRAIDYDGVRYLVLQEPNDYRVAFEAFEALREKMLGNTDEVEEKPKKLVASSLEDIDHVLEMFGLLNNLSQDEGLRRTHSVTRLCTKNEAIARVVIRQILISSISEENDAALKSFRAVEGIEADPKDTAAPFDTALCAPVMHDGEEKILGGYLDYTLFYKHTARTTELTTLSANLVVMEAKWKNSTDTATAQIVSYMEWEGGEDSDSGEIYFIMRQVIRTAKLSSPSTSPIKNPNHREVVLSTFGREDQAKSFDFYLNNLVI
ncbi:MAG: hypothetical protein MMC33_000614 [Icmadophila ericetorum]|nr:hypothetical protein [Icmadophila ericetorum]